MDKKVEVYKHVSNFSWKFLDLQPDIASLLPRETSKKNQEISLESFFILSCNHCVVYEQVCK